MKYIFAVVVGLAIAVNALVWSAGNIGPWMGVDFRLFREFGQRWLDTGSMYLPLQLEGPYSVWWNGDLATTPAMYPPAVGPVFGLLALLPLPLAIVAWWGIPVTILGFAFYRWRPAPWTWALMAVLFVHPANPITFVVGSSTMWIMALVTLGLLYHWPAALILLKPTLAPFALIGMRDWRWWAIAGVILVTTVAGGYLDVVRNGTDSGGFLYSLTAYPLLCVPLLAYLTRVREPEAVKNHPGESLYVAEAAA